MWSRTCQHAIRAMVAVAQHDGEGYVTAKSVSTTLGLPPSFLAKILQRLTAAGLLASLRGPTGGVALARPADAIRLADIVMAIDGKLPFDDCLFGWQGCSGVNPCPLHAKWEAVTIPFVELLGTESLAEHAGLSRSQTAANGLLRAAKRDKRLVNRKYTS